MENHDLYHEFPKMHDAIHELKVSDAHFKKLYDEYHEINKDIHRIESGAENTTDQVLTDLRLKRVFLKDELYAILQKHTVN
jgi:uncharacterized protein YdcH (DUF465 family)